MQGFRQEAAGAVLGPLPAEIGRLFSGAFQEAAADGDKEQHHGPGCLGELERLPAGQQTFLRLPVLVVQAGVAEPRSGPARGLDWRLSRRIRAWSVPPSVDSARIGRTAVFMATSFPAGRKRCP